MNKILYIFLFLIISTISLSSEKKVKSIIEGNIDAKIELIVYESLTCGHCASFHEEIYPNLKKDFIDKGLVKIEFRNFPLDLAAFNASKIAHCRNDGKSDILHFLYKNQKEWANVETIDQANTSLKKIIKNNYSDLNFEKLIFEDFFVPKECISSNNDWFQPHSSGGRMTKFKDKFLLSIGEYLDRNKAQNPKSIFGKIVVLDPNNKNNYNLISIGHRNVQGLVYDDLNKAIISTEHGPKGGDEINLIEISKINKDKIQNYGWAISSAGEHYGGVIEENKAKYEKYPLYKSHSEHGFIEPLKSFNPSIGISEIVKVKQNRYVVSSLKDKSLYFFELNEQKKIINLNRIEVFERVRDLRFYNNQLYLFLEDTASIGIINFN